MPHPQQNDGEVWKGSVLHESNPPDHYVGSLYAGCGSLSPASLHFSGRRCRNDRRDLLTTDGNPGHQTANRRGLNSSHSLITIAHAPDFFFALFLGLATGSEEQSVHFALRDRMMFSRSPIASNLLLVNPLLIIIVRKLIPSCEAASRSFSTPSTFPWDLPFFSIGPQS